jgi:hypothetical protein
MPTNRALALPATLVTAILLAACSGAAAASPTPPAGTPIPTPTRVPGDSGADVGSGGGGGSGGSSGSGSTGSGVLVPFPGDQGNGNPLFGNATYVTPASGLLNIHGVSVQLVRATMNSDGAAIVDLRWWSGVAPCNQLASVDVARDLTAKTVRLQVNEGSGGGQVACIDIAQLTATQVELAGLASGTWTISAAGDAPPIELDVP